MTDYTSGAADPAEQSGRLFTNIPVILWQRRWFVIVPAVLLAVAGVLAAYLLPRTYRSSAVLLVESQDLPGGTTGSPDEDPIDRRIAKFRQQILSRPDLVDLIQTHDLYSASSRSEPLSDLVDRMRDATAINAVDADVQRMPRGNNNGSIAFSLSFSYSRPAQAQLVAQTFVDRLMKLDASSTRVQAETNVHYLEDQEQGLQAQVSAIEGQINRLAGVNGAALSSAGLGMVSAGAGVDYATQIANLQRENATLASQQTTAVERDPNVLAAQAQLSAAKALYSDEHPDVKLAEKRLALVRSNAQSFQTKGVSSVVRQQIASNNTAIGQLSQQRSVEQGRASAMAAAQARGPAIAAQVTQLQAKADAARTNLARVSSSLLTARTNSKMVDEQRGERLTLIEPPVTPDRPSSPNRPLLIAGGLVGGILLGGLMAMLVELLQQPIRNVGQLTAIVGEPPLAIVPILSSGEARKHRRRRARWWPRKRAALPSA